MTATQEPALTGETARDLREEALQRLKKKQDFRAHVLVYVLVNALLWAIWALATPDSLIWPVFPMAGWGVGLVMNAWDVYGRRPITDSDVRAEMDRLRRG